MVRRKKQKISLLTLIIFLIIAIIFVILNKDDILSWFNDKNSIDYVTDDCTLAVHFIDVGQGDSILLSHSDGKNQDYMIIDGGPNSCEDYLINYLDNVGVDKFDYVVATHPHEDHIGSLDKVLEIYKTSKVLLPEVDNDTSCWYSFYDAMTANADDIVYTRCEDTFLWGDISIYVLAPYEDDYEEINNYSLVLKVTHGKDNFLFTGDAEMLSEEEILTGGYDLVADVLKAGHHGSAYSTGEDFLAAVNPQYAVISCGKGNSYGHPHKELLQRLAADGVEVLRTDTEGSIIFISDKSGNVTLVE